MKESDTITGHFCHNVYHSMRRNWVCWRVGVRLMCWWVGIFVSDSFSSCRRGGNLKSGTFWLFQASQKVRKLEKAAGLEWQNLPLPNPQYTWTLTWPCHISHLATHTNPFPVYIVYNWPLSTPPSSKTHPPILEIMIQGLMLILMILFDENQPKTIYTVPDSRNHFGRREKLAISWHLAALCRQSYCEWV